MKKNLIVTIGLLAAAVLFMGAEIANAQSTLDCVAKRRAAARLRAQNRPVPDSLNCRGNRIRSSASYYEPKSFFLGGHVSTSNGDMFGGADGQYVLENGLTFLAVADWNRDEQRYMAAFGYEFRDESQNISFALTGGAKFRGTTPGFAGDALAKVKIAGPAFFFAGVTAETVENIKPPFFTQEVSDGKLVWVHNPGGKEDVVELSYRAGIAFGL
jgi:hypothetical protein